MCTFRLSRAISPPVAYYMVFSFGLSELLKLDAESRLLEPFFICYLDSDYFLTNIQIVLDLALSD